MFRHDLSGWVRLISSLLGPITVYPLVKTEQRDEKCLYSEAFSESTNSYLMPDE